jgi:hypothetical protein
MIGMGLIYYNWFMQICTIFMCEADHLLPFIADVKNDQAIYFFMAWWLIN